MPHGKRLTTEKYIERAIKKHGEKYDYSKAIYVHSMEPVELICNQHGSFNIVASSHLSGKGCQKCGRDGTKGTTEEFVAKAKVLYGDRFDYSKTVYNTLRTKLEITCREHGPFKLYPYAHFTGNGGCRVCSGNKPMTTEEYIQRAKSIHGDLYDYSLSKYIDSKTKITIICKNHGEFHVLPSNHFKGKKCPKCKFRVSKPETAWLDSLKIPKECRQKTLLMNSGKRYEVDAFDPHNNTVYEFNGDYWHGNPAKFDGNAWNHRNDCTFGELYQKTLTKERELILNNYNIISIWENDFKKYISLSKNNSLKPFAD